jgi:hypothetical protein
MLSIALLALSSAHAQQATSPTTKITGIYSDMSYNAEGGDITGVEVFLVYSRDGYRVVYQSSEGEPGPPVVLPATINGKSIRFSIPKSIDARGEFVGSIDATEIVGTFSGNGQTVHLPRHSSYWQ